MLFVVERSLKQTAVSDDSYSIKRVCMDPIIIDALCSQGQFFTQSKV
jgi:hypothetical protein